MPMSIPVMRATTTSADAMPCCAAGTTRSAAEDSGPITRPRPIPATTRSVSRRGRVKKPKLCTAANTSTGHPEIR
ncbi:Uncharacterised protein [Mycobacteroides abscessus subsp. massiliense]|nr:Uncharacterised protein [Mycobacteroides abscessus subsp. massiliense]